MRLLTLNNLLPRTQLQLIIGRLECKITFKIFMLNQLRVKTTLLKWMTSTQSLFHFSSNSSSFLTFSFPLSSSLVTSSILPFFNHSFLPSLLPTSLAFNLFVSSSFSLSFAITSNILSSLTFLLYSLIPAMPSSSPLFLPIRSHTTLPLYIPVASCILPRRLCPFYLHLLPPLSLSRIFLLIIYALALPGLSLSLSLPTLSLPTFYLTHFVPPSLSLSL